MASIGMGVKSLESPGLQGIAGEMGGTAAHMISDKSTAERRSFGAAFLFVTQNRGSVKRRAA